MPMRHMTAVASFRAFAELCGRLEATKSRNEKIRQISSLISGLQPSEVPVAVRFLTGRVFGEQEMRKLGVGGATLWKLAKANTLQVPLLPTEMGPSLLDVNRALESLASLSGTDRQQRAENILQALFSRFSEPEKKYGFRLLSGEMEIGAVDGVLLAAIAAASKLRLEKVRRAYMTMGDIGHIAELALTNPSAVDTAKIVVFNPVRPMLAEMATSILEILKCHKDGTAFEYKYDGARIQIHKQGEEVRIFSRRLSDVTASIPEIVALVKDRVINKRGLLEGELIAVDDSGKPLPFQDLMRRFRRVHDVTGATARVPLQLHLFDILVIGDEELVDRSYTIRRKMLEQEVPQELLAPCIVSKDEGEIQGLFEKALGEGHEGLMAKALDSKYEVGKRGKKWFKLKRAETLDLAIVAADWGYGRRSDWLSNYHLAVREENTGEFLVVGKTFKGLTDEEFTEMTKRLQALKSSETEFTVTVKPEIVVEVAYDEIQRSPHYKSGFALRFARITRIRDDKNPDQVDSLQRMRALYDQQFSRKGMYK
jgi:DNA ligase-1